MNFVDVQPKSFLDYAWTSPSPVPMDNNAKLPRTGRKQNRCCDQCRKGKRACDATILEDTLLDASSGSNPTVFHYSDVFGPLVACGNCEKTRKECTFEWLRSQRVPQATLSPPKIAPRVNRRKTQSDCAPPLQSQEETGQSIYDEKPTLEFEEADICQPTNPIDLGIMSVDFPAVPAYLMGSSLALTQASTPPLDKNKKPSVGGALKRDTPITDFRLPSHEQPEASPKTSSEHSKDTIERRHRFTPDTHDRTKNKSTASTNDNAKQVHRSQRRRRGSPRASRSENVQLESALTLATDLFSSGNKLLLTERLLQIYHKSFENALACWLTERTCPYSAKVDISLVNEVGPSWNRIYHRVFRLDRLTSSIRGRQLTLDEDRAVSKALNLSIFSFATQWGQSQERDKARYPFHSDSSEHGTVLDGGTKELRDEIKFDRTIQVVAWHKARVALESAEKTESFRLALAQIVFALTQQPLEDRDNLQSGDRRKDTEGSALDLTETEEEDKTTALDQHEIDFSGCESLMSKLNLAIDAESPSVHLEKGLRLIHSLKSRMALCGDGSRPNATRGGRRRYQPSANLIDATDRATVNLLFWLGVMFDTLSSAMHRRPLVISDEDSDVYAKEPKPTSRIVQNSKHLAASNNGGTGWDEHLFAHQSARLQKNPVRWPCTFEQASALLCDAAPVKILLFRKITRIQTLLARNCSREGVEESITAALDVYDHWERIYAPFVRDCIRSHDRLPSKIQSWYVCLTGHWHFGTLLLADLIETVDEAGLGTEVMKAQRGSCEMVAHFRESNCQTLSDLARCACPQYASYTELKDSPFGFDEREVLTEPWTVVLIRAFARAGVILLESESMLPHHGSNIVWAEEEALRRADDCVRVLWYLGRNFDMALAAAKVLRDALKQRRQGASEKLDRMTSVLEAELWHDFANTSESFDINYTT